MLLIFYYVTDVVCVISVYIKFSKKQAKIRSKLNKSENNLSLGVVNSPGQA